MRLWAISSILFLTAYGCVSTPQPEEFTLGSSYGLEFPDKRHLIPWGEYHDVFVVIERSKLTTKPFPVLPKRAGMGELFDFGEDQQIEYRNQFFQVGRHRYPAGGNSTLFVFLERQGPWTFEYRGVSITIDHPGQWKPAVLRHAVYVADPNSQVTQDPSPTQPRGRRYNGTRPVNGSTQVRRFDHERLLVGTSTIVLRAAQPGLEINGERVAAFPGTRVTIDRRGNTKLAPR